MSRSTVSAGTGAGGRRGSSRRRLGAWLDRLLPPACVACGESLEPGTAPVCALCWHRLPRVVAPRCRRCGATRLLDLGREDRCSECLSWPEHLPRTRAPFRMDAGAARLVHALKYEGWFTLARPMGEALAAAALELAGEVVHRLEPVPLPAARLRERGYNQAELLARSLGIRLGWPVGAALSRDDARRRQVRLGRNERRENVREAFHARAGSTDELPVLLVDDVLTTGATAAACALALRDSGEQVTGAVAFARALQVMGSS